MIGMRTALAMGLIIAATYGLSAAPVFAQQSSGQSGGAAAAPAANSGAGSATSPGAGTRADKNVAAPPANTNKNAASAPAQSNHSNAAASSQQKPKKHMAMSRKRVEQVQAALDSHGQNISVDGVWGPKTIDAMKAFQKSAGLPATGHFDHRTAKALPLTS